MLPSCAKYKKEFSSKNKLFKHLKAYGHTKQGFSKICQSQNSPFQKPRISAPSPLYSHPLKAQSMASSCSSTSKTKTPSPPPTQLAKAQPIIQPSIPPSKSAPPPSKIRSSPPNSQAQPSVSPPYSPPSYAQIYTPSPTKSTTKFRAQDLGFFNPDCSKKPIKIRNDRQIYHNTYSFTEKLRAMDSLALRQNLKMCLLNKTD